MRALTWVLGLWLLLVTGAAAQQARDFSGISATEIKALQQRLAGDGCYQGAVDGRASQALQAAIAGCPSQDPILRIEAGTHLAAIHQIGLDQACRIAATGSLDRTIRVWSFPDGHLLRTLRVPIDLSNGGQIFASAVSPDGRMIAAAGLDAQTGLTGQTYIYVFAAASGELLARVALGLPAAPDLSVDRLTFSPDGRWLAATTNRPGTGLAILDMQTWRIVSRDQDYPASSQAMGFAPDGRLYTAAFDGKLRQYAPGPRFQRQREVMVRGGRLPLSVAIDPSGKLLAVGFADTPRIDFYDAATLRFRFSASPHDVTSGNLAMIAWSSDGTRLFAGGTYGQQVQNKMESVLLVFDRSGHQIGGAVPLQGPHNSILDLQLCGTAIAVSVGGPSIGLVSVDGQIQLWKASAAPDMRNKFGDGLLISRDAKQVRFGLQAGDERPVLFDLVSATVTAAASRPPDFIPALIQGLPLGGIASDPTFDGRPLRLGQAESVHSQAIRSDHNGFVLGTEEYLHAFDADGRQLWQQPSVSVTWGVDISADGRIIVAAYGDGTIRWHRWSDGKELLALFVDGDNGAWVAWTPTGYYMASPGGENLIGWHVNRGWNQAADFFPASRFRERFNRPDIVQLVLTTLDEDAAIKQANAVAKRREDFRPLIGHLPPVIRIAAPADGATVTENKVTLDYVVRSPSGQPVDRVDLLVNGRPVKSIGLPIKPLAPQAESKGSVQVTLTQHSSEVGLLAWSGDISSQAAQVKVIWNGSPEVTRKLFALVVGVSNYADPAMALKYAAKDAGDFAKVLQDQKGRYYADVQTKVLTDREVTRASLIQGLQWLEQSATNPNDVSVLFLAGHGVTDEKQTYWFYTSDSNDDNVLINGVSQDEFRRLLQGLQGKVLWFLDTCHAGTAAKRPRVDMNVLVNTISASENGGVVVFASSTGRQASVESGDLGNGAFTKAVVEGIGLGKAALGDGFITTSTLDSYVVRRVEQFTGDQQTPVMERPPEEPDFAIAEAKK